MSNAINPAYSRLCNVAASIADAAYIAGGLDGMHAELCSLRRSDANPVVIAEVERLYHNQCKRVLPEARLALSY